MSGILTAAERDFLSDPWREALTAHGYSKDRFPAASAVGPSANMQAIDAMVPHDHGIAQAFGERDGQCILPRPLPIESTQVHG